MPILIKVNYYINLIYLRLSDPAEANGGCFGLFHIFCFLFPRVVFLPPKKVKSRVEFSWKKLTEIGAFRKE